MATIFANNLSRYQISSSNEMSRIISGLFLILMVGCGHPESKPVLTLATTTSTRDSGLLDVLVPMFERETGIEVRVVAVGSGQALELGRRGDADVLLTHAPEAEQQFIEEGYAARRQPVMYNDFVLVGPAQDPAGVSGQTSITDALQQIAASQALFIARGDDSGTHLKERSVWRGTDVTPAGPWYVEAGGGMAETLRMASEKAAYTLSDRGTFLAQQQGLELAIVSQGDARLKNEYAVLLIDPARHSHVHAEAARQFAAFLLSDQAQQTIGRFGVDQFGQPLFFPRSE